jgi:hypothetical protein
MATLLDDVDVPLVTGTAAGVAAWLVGYVCAYAVAGTRIRESALGRVLEVLGDGAAVYKLVGWVFYNSHFVNTVFEGLPVAVAGSAVGGENGFTPLLFVVPPALLFAAGLALGRYHGVETPRDGAVTGLGVVPGYLLLALVGVFLFTISAGPASGRPDPVLGVVLTGIVYPAVFGVLGCAVAGATAGG